jgi:hypothetical protein
MDAATKRLVRQRAADRCEYCQLAEIHSALRFHIEHIVAEQHGGKDTLDNLALACPECNFAREQISQASIRTADKSHACFILAAINGMNILVTFTGRSSAKR